MRETLLVIRDFKDDKLQPGEMYNYKELQALFKEMEGEVQTLVDKVRRHSRGTGHAWLTEQGLVELWGAAQAHGETGRCA